MEGVQSLRVRLLGDLRVEGCDPALLGRRQLRTLLKILALHHDHPVSTDRLIYYLWGDQPPTRATDQISVLISRLRNVVGAERLARSDAGYRLAVDWLDVDALGDYAVQAEHRLALGAVGAARAASSAGLSLARGPLLADESDPWWAQAERAASDLLIDRLRHTGAAASLAARDWADAISLSSLLLDRDPFDEVALRCLMEALDRAGRPASALAAYAQARQRLAEALGIDPSAKTEALHAAILRGEDPTDAAPPGTQAGPSPDLPGRAEALGELQGLLDRAAHGQATVAVVEGPAGIGKSRLLDVWTTHLESHDLCVVRVACDELGHALPFQPLLDVISELAHHFAHGDPATTLGLEGAVLGPLIGLQTEPAGAAELAALTDPDAGQALMFGALTGVLRRLAEREPLVLLLDDVHLADPATLRWLAQASRRLADRPILIVAARRSEEGMPLPNVPTITLAPLDLDAVTRIVGPDRAVALHERSGGNALFLVELAAIEDEGELPASIRHAVEERCRRAGTAGATLCTAAVIGPDIDLDLLAAVTGTGPSELLDHLEIGLHRNFLVEDGPTFIFAHALVRDALAATVGASRTAFIHRSAARALGSRSDPDPLAVARHARLGGELEDAASMLLVAAKVAVIRFDTDSALRLLDEAITLHDTAAARLERARINSMLARAAEADEDIAVARLLGAGPEALEVAAWSAHFARRFGDALLLADQGAAEADTDDLRTACLALGGWVALASGDLSGAEARLESALGVAPETSGRMAESWMAWLRMNQGRPEESLRLAHHAPGKGLAAYRFPNAYGLMATVTGLATLGRAEEALATIDLLESEVRRMGASRWVPRPLNLRGWVTRNLGEPTQADEMNQEALEAARAADLAEPWAHALLDLAAGRLLQDEWDAAATFLDQADGLLAEDHAFRWRHELRGRLLTARLDLARGDPEVARVGAEALVTDATARGIPRYRVQAQLVAAMAARQYGRTVDPIEVDRLLGELDEVAGLESWWITADVAKAFGVGRWEELARRRVGDLQAHAGRYAASLERAAARRLG
jgi:DNA-binding SARP family transcriptional activator